MTVSEKPGMQFADIPWKGRTIQLEYQWVGVAESPCPVVVFLHEGLGSVATWKEFPQRFCEEHGLRGLVFSRYGYGQSTRRPVEEPLPLSYLHDQAYEALPAFLSALGVERPWLFGHSDGGSIALLYAARFPEAVSGIVVVAPHIFVEDVTVEGIRKVREMYLNTDFGARLGRYHADGDAVFLGWNNAWLDPDFRNWNIEDEVRKITCPVLALQGEQDEYATLEQIHGIERLARHERNARAVAIPQCGHVPHRDQPALLSMHAGRFIKEA
ncbi:MAG TPA: alpha/beta hydrolase [Noviherbaspirillum sp.]|uniref:alpha/beta fold hydrolase n=1 Tax=Noviherbaspirillum sp. TaxID=1926288 RepID=UPI002B4A8682|nr:alpha/beta hydrolase [Noviherbaspirillum sp.]HJV86429.1 alpha/beta hydrolase [Noviherbaspirillum sp.]